MLTINIPDRLTNKINKFAGMVSQKPEDYIIELIEERIANDGL